LSTKASTVLKQKQGANSETHKRELFAEYIEKHRQSIYSKIIQSIPEKLPDDFNKMVKSYVERQGKYGRPSFIVLWCELHGGKPEDALPAAATMQCSEDWILMHDDFEDGNEVRRGKPAAHIQFGARQAINAADYLHMVNWKMAHEATAQLRKQKGNELGEAYFNKFYDMMLTTAEGQYFDMKLTHEIKQINNFSLEDYYKSIHAKTAYYSVYGPMQMGAIIAGKDKKYIEKIKSYGVPIGRAFQLKDDILDCTSTVEVLGKSVGNDVREGVKTPLLLNFVQKATPTDFAKVAQIYAKEREDKTEDEVKFVLEMFDKYDSVQYAEELVDKLAAEALANFEKETKEIPESEIKETARNAIEKMVKRKK
jgi:geranylgeranyl diphosphate synthase type II